MDDRDPFAPLRFPSAARPRYTCAMRWTLPNILTVARMIAAPLVGLIFLILPRPYADWVAMILFLSASLTDYVDGYLARYAPTFKTPDGESRKAWEAERRNRIAKPRKIEVKIEAPKVTFKEMTSCTYGPDLLPLG